MIKRIDGSGLADLACVLEAMNLSQRGSADPKRIKVSYEYDSVGDTFSIRCEELPRAKGYDGAA